MSNLNMLSNLIKLNRNLNVNKLILRTLATKTNDLLVNKCFKLNQSSIRLNETDSKSESNKNEDNKQDKPRSTLSKNRTFFSWRTLGISSLIAASYFGAVMYLKQLKEDEWEKERVRSLGKAAIGGSFELIDTNNKIVTNEDFKGKWVLIYFGFTHCPDVCPEEIEKMVEVFKRVKKANKNAEIVPLFVSIDPDRDTPEIVKKYCEEFSPDIIGLTGNKEQIKKVSKNFRVYYSPGPKSSDQDYIVDHTIIMYLLSPEGDFVDYYGQTRDAEMVTNAVLINMKKWDVKKKGSWF